MSAATASDDLARQRHRARKMEQAVDEWLSDPDDSEKFSLSPRASEIPVIYFSSTSDGKSVRKKAKPSELLETVEAVLGVTVSYADTSGVADARKLFVDLMRATNSQVELLGKLSGEFISEKKHPKDATRESSRSDALQRLIVEHATTYNLDPDAVRERLFARRPELKAWQEGGEIVG